MDVNYHWDFHPVFEHFPMLLTGFENTAKLAIVAIILGAVFGLVLTFMRLATHRSIRYPAIAFIEFYRNTPALVHFFWFYYALPVVVNVNLDPFTAAILALATQSSAFYAEVYRGGIISIERGQWEASKALGMHHHQLMKRIILPQAFSRMIPPFVERTFELIKTTTLASTLAYAEILYQATRVSSETYRPIEVYTTVAVIFIVTLALASLAFNRLEKRLVTYRAR